MDQFRHRIGGIGFGGDYNPEQWDRDTWREDMRLMRAAGVNSVTLGVFAWASLEPSPGQFEFEWMDEVMDLLHDNGIAVDLATPTMAPPAWLTHEHPEVLPVMEDGNIFGFGNRLQFDPTSPIYREAAARITTALAERYSHHPALAMWHISNELGPVAYNPQTSRAFRTWLKDRYGDLDGLNEAWYTRFWSQTYTDWEQVEVPQTPRSWMNPTRKLDYRRFLSHALLECYLAERDIVRSYRDDIPVLTNYMRFYRSADYWQWAPHQDAVALDIYPNPGDPDSHVSAALQYDLMRSLGGREPWVLMEQAASAVSQWPVNNVKRPGRMRLGSLQAIAHGADTVFFFQWRAGRGGHERFHSAMLPHSGADARTWKEVTALGHELKALAPLAGTTTTAQVAQLFDWDVWWSLTETHGIPRNDFDFTHAQTEHYRPLYEQHISTDMISLDSSLEPYRLLIIPHAQLMHQQFVDRLTAWVQAGGTALITFFSGVVDPRNQVVQPAYPGWLRELIGAYIDEYWPALGDEQFGLSYADGTSGQSDWWRDSLTLETAEPLATYNGGDMDGRPAITSHQVGSGRVVYVGTRLSRGDWARLVKSTTADAGVEPVVACAPWHVGATVRSDGEADYLVLLNHSETDVASVTVPRPGTDLLTRSDVAASITVGPGDAAVVRMPHAPR